MTQGRIAAADGHFSRICQVQHQCAPHLQKTKNGCQLAMAMSLSYRVSGISAFCWPTTQTPSITNSLVTIVHIKPVIATLVQNWLPWQRPSAPLESHLTRLLGPRAHNPNGISVGYDIFAQMTAECPYAVLYNGTPLPRRITPSHGDLDPQSLI